MIYMMKLMRLLIRPLCGGVSSRMISLKTMMVADMPTMEWTYVTKIDTIRTRRMAMMHGEVGLAILYHCRLRVRAF